MMMLERLLKQRWCDTILSSYESCEYSVRSRAFAMNLNHYVQSFDVVEQIVNLCALRQHLVIARPVPHHLKHHDDDQHYNTCE